MASSESFQTGQAPSVCHLCEEGTIEWKCRTCDYLMCTRCCKVHKKIKSSDEHTIVDLKNIGLHEDDAMLDFKNIACQKHRAEKCCLFCSDCQIVVCSVCITENHSGDKHSFIKIDKGYEISVEKLKNLISLINKKSRELETGEMFANHADDQSKIEKEKEKIRSKGDALVQDVNQQTTKFLEELDKRWSNQCRKIQNHVQYSSISRKKLETKKIETELLLASKNVDDVFQAVQNDVEYGIPSFQIMNFNCESLVEFIPGESTSSVVQSIFGTIIDNDVIVPSEIAFRVIKQYASELQYIHNIVCGDSNGSIWLNDNVFNVIRNARFTNGALEPINTFQIRAECIGLLTKNIVISGRKTLEIMSRDTGKLCDSKFSHGHFFNSTSSDFYIGRDKIVIIFDDTEIVVFDFEANKEIVYPIEPPKGQVILKENPRPFRQPKKVAIDSVGNIYILDSCPQRIVVLNQGGDLRGSYERPQFSAVDLVITQSDNAIILGEHAELVVLNSDGVCLNSSKLSLKDVDETYSVAINGDGILLIGGSGKKGSKISVVRFTGC